MARAKKKKRSKGTGFLETYRSIRKPMPPAQKVMKDRRRKDEEDRARREVEEGEGPRFPGSA
ncbi:MAG TPA: hypothetical protein VF986_04570 [Actinomycetota bacterium]|jgi:hypothetical protein|nr:hypothetical protein [Actinomycetota bacterium]